MSLMLVMPIAIRLSLSANAKSADMCLTGWLSTLLRKPREVCRVHNATHRNPPPSLQQATAYGMGRQEDHQRRYKPSNTAQTAAERMVQARAACGRCGHRGAQRKYIT